MKIKIAYVHKIRIQILTVILKIKIIIIRISRLQWWSELSWFVYNSFTIMMIRIIMNYPELFWPTYFRPEFSTKAKSIISTNIIMVWLNSIIIIDNSWLIRIDKYDRTQTIYDNDVTMWSIPTSLHLIHSATDLCFWHHYQL